MARVACKDANLRCTREPVSSDIPSPQSQLSRAGGSEACDMCHLAARHERKARMVGQTENLFQPLSGHFFDNGRCRAASEQRGILIPNGNKPVCRRCGRKRAPNDPSKKST